MRALACTQPRLEAALSDGPLATPCPHGHDLVFAPGWFCEDCRACVFPDMVHGDDDEPDADYS